ncbi:hypothetical protein [Flagellimonas zhangzhouensis]|uniref:Uncharacterized protein n=1 Tax=Flagellimonas zhangzhouensis TaxID=1073328 RepID=A0A1H2V5R2_9FLAO|nr:hypothetical protein [Allomuricauda zhangzhouensis]SDQ10904.1 hypothetical protein SAMN05216294_0379 [Allomuricauda zhangzhouensis]SDW63259.1 hypothetical protein SAMN04487892_1912 [Allomuricauda zhangzhouensis]
MQFYKIKSSVNPNAFFSILFIVLLILLSSCENEEEPSLVIEENQSNSLLFDKAGIERAELKEKLAYKNYHLTKLMEELYRLNPNFDNEKAGKSAKAEHLNAFYFKDLFSKNIEGKSESTLNDSIQYSLEAFIELEGESWYPYVYKIKDGTGTQPLFLINSFDLDLKKEIVQGYILNVRGQLELKYRDLLENDIFGPNPVEEALENEVFVLGIAPEDQEYILPEDENADSYGGGGGNDDILPEDLQIFKIKIKDKKESWLEKADVHIYGYAMSDDEDFFQPLGFFWGDRITIDGAQIRNNPEYVLGKFSNSDVNNGTFKTINKHLMNKRASSSIFISYIIYEYDGFPAPLKQVSFGRPGGTDALISYRSYNQKYISAQVRACDDFIPENYFVLNGFGNSISNSTIEFYYNASN